MNRRQSRLRLMALARMYGDKTTRAGALLAALFEQGGEPCTVGGHYRHYIRRWRIYRGTVRGPAGPRTGFIEELETVKLEGSWKVRHVPTGRAAWLPSFQKHPMNGRLYPVFDERFADRKAADAAREKIAALVDNDLLGVYGLRLMTPEEINPDTSRNIMPWCGCGSPPEETRTCICGRALCRRHAHQRRFVGPYFCIECYEKKFGFDPIS